MRAYNIQQPTTSAPFICWGSSSHFLFASYFPFFDFEPQEERPRS